MQTFRWFFQNLFVVVVLTTVGCGEGISGDNPEPTADQVQIGTLSQEIISSTAANKLINDGRAKIGTVGGQCKDWVKDVTLTSYSKSIPSTNPSKQYEWYYEGNSSLNPATVMAKWLGSYVNNRAVVTGLSPNTSKTLPSVTIAVYDDPQVLVIYSTNGGVTAELAKGTTKLSVTSPVKNVAQNVIPNRGTVSSQTVSGLGTWTLSVRNNNIVANDVVVVVLSQSRFKSDWETARRGDIIQMYIRLAGTKTGTDGKLVEYTPYTTPHTTFVQTDLNAIGMTVSGGTCVVTNTTGCNWLDSNWVKSVTVGAHNTTMNEMMVRTAYSSDLGFTVYRLN